MTANLYEKNNRYHVMLSWYDGKKRKQKSVATGIPVPGNNKRKAEEERKRILEDWKHRIILCLKEILFSVYLLQWLEGRRHSIAETTYYSYKQTLENVICPYFAKRKIKLHELKAEHIEQFYQMKLDAGISGNTISHYQANIHKALKDAVRKDLIPDNPAAKVSLPRIEKFRGDYYTPDELRALVNAFKGTRLEVPIYLASWYGLRRGEVVGLRWDSINYETKTLSILGSVTNKGSGTPAENEIYRATGKTNSSIRSFPMSEDQINYFISLRNKQDENRILCGNSYNTDYLDFVCVDMLGNRVRLGYITKAFTDTLRKLGFRKIRFHDLRHTNITLLLESGASLKELQEWAGHANFNTTADTYAHVQAKAKIKLTDTMSGILSANC